MNGCLYCGKALPQGGAFCACCSGLKNTCLRERSTYWELLKVLADRGDTGIPDKAPVLDEWERLGIVRRDTTNSQYRFLSERGKALYEHILVRRLKRYPEEAEAVA